MIQSIDPKSLYSRLQSGEPIRIVDVRTAMEFRMGHVAGATNIPLTSIRDHIEGVAGDELIAVICQSGHRSHMACQKIEAAHPQALSVSGGTAAWAKAGLPIEQEQGEPLSVSRQTHLVAGLMLVAALVLAKTVSPNWIYLAALPAFGLLLDATTGVCPMTLILKRMPWNKGATCC